MGYMHAHILTDIEYTVLDIQPNYKVSRYNLHSYIYTNKHTNNRKTHTQINMRMLMPCISRYGVDSSLHGWRKRETDAKCGECMNGYISWLKSSEAEHLLPETRQAEHLYTRFLLQESLRQHIERRENYPYATYMLTHTRAYWKQIIWMILTKVYLEVQCLNIVYW